MDEINIEDLLETELDQELRVSFLVDAGEESEEDRHLRRQEYAQKGTVLKTQRILEGLIAKGNTMVYAPIKSTSDLISVIEAEKDNCLRMARKYAKGDTDMADDIYQKATIRAYCYLNNERPLMVQRRAVKRIQLDDEQPVNSKVGMIIVKNPVAWLHCIVRNTAINEIRGQKRKNGLLGNLRRDLERESPRFESPETTVLRNISYTELRYYVNSLSEQFSIIINYHYFEELTYEEIAKKLNCSSNTVRTHAKRALAILNDILSNRRVVEDGKIGRRSRRKPNFEKAG